MVCRRRDEPGCAHDARGVRLPRSGEGVRGHALCRCAGCGLCPESRGVPDPLRAGRRPVGRRRMDGARRWVCDQHPRGRGGGPEAETVEIDARQPPADPDTKRDRFSRREPVPLFSRPAPSAPRCSGGAGRAGPEERHGNCRALPVIRNRADRLKTALFSLRFALRAGSPRLVGTAAGSGFPSYPYSCPL